METRAFRLGGGLPVSQTVGDFLAGRASGGFGRVQPTALPGVTPGDIRRVLPGFVCDGMAEGLKLLDRKLRGFAHPEAVLTCPETRSSSPVRIPRDRDGCCSVMGLYPCGEGAGWAGGITSAAVDGLRAAEWLMAGSD